MLAVSLEAAIPEGKEGMASRRPVLTVDGGGQTRRTVNPSASNDCRILVKWAWRMPEKHLIMQYPQQRDLGEQKKREEFLFLRPQSQDPLFLPLLLTPVKLRKGLT